MRVKELSADAVAGTVVFAFGVFVLVASLGIPDPASETEVVGPKALPVTFSGALAVAGLALLVHGLRTGSRASEQEGEGEDGGTPPKPGQARRLLVLGAMLLGYILVFIPLGYLLSTFAFLVGVSMYIEPRKWIRNLVFAAVFAVAVYVAFTRGLQVGLPPGILG